MSRLTWANCIEANAKYRATLKRRIAELPLFSLEVELMKRELKRIDADDELFRFLSASATEPDPPQASEARQA